MPIIDLGKVVGDPGASMRFRGEWNNESEYFNNASYIDAVTHNGSLWICKVTNTNQVPATGTYWGIGAQGMAEDNMVFSAYSAFPSVGDENKLYIDNTVNPALIYIWNGSAYIPAGGGGEITAADVNYDNEISGLASQTVQEAIDENAEAISALNSSPEVINITPISGSNYSGYGNCYYYKKGSRVHIHIGIQGLTGGVNTTISILPSGYRPSSLISAIGFGTGWSEKAVLLITQNGELNVQSEGSYAMIDVEYDAFS